MWFINGTKLFGSIAYSTISELVTLWRWYESWSLLVKRPMVCLWMPFLSLRKAELRVFFKFDTSILPLAIESRRGSMTRDDSLARMRPVIAMWYKIRTGNRDEENPPNERWTVVLCDLSIGHRQGALSSFFRASLYAYDASVHLANRSLIFTTKDYNLS